MGIERTGFGYSKECQQNGAVHLQDEGAEKGGEDVGLIVRGQQG